MPLWPAAPASQSIIGTHSPAELLAQLKKPRRVMLMVQAGPSRGPRHSRARASARPRRYPHRRRQLQLPRHDPPHSRASRQGLALRGHGRLRRRRRARLKGPSIMPGGNPAAWPHIKDLFQAIAAKVEDGSPCCDWVGRDGAGHYVKMVHNGIEYGDMQMIAEAYALMREGLGIEPQEQSEIFKQWNEGELDSYLIEITGDILAKTDDETGQPMVDVILDTAGQKGTGKWTGIDALQLGAPVTAITEAVFSRALSFLKDERVAAAQRPPRPRRFIHWRQRRFRRRHPPSPVRGQNLLLRPRLSVARPRRPRVWLGTQLRRHRPAVARRLHHSRLSFWAASRKPLTRIQRWPICCSHPTSAQQSHKLKRLGAESWPRLRRLVSPCQPLPALLRTTMAIALPAYPPTYSKPSATTSVPTPMSALTSRAACSFTPIGPGAGERRHRRLTTSNSQKSI